MKIIHQYLLIFLLPLLAFPTKAFCTVTVYPASDGLVQSTDFSVSVNGLKIWTEKYTSNLDFPNLPDWFNDPAVRKPQVMNIAAFDGTGTLNVSVTVSGKVKNVKIRPVSRNIEPKITGNTISFNWNGPGQLVIEVGDKPPLFLFANPEETAKPLPAGENVKYFGPGVHKTGYIELRDNETLYLAAGAVVYGGIRAKNVSNIKVLGRGILDGNYEFRQMVEIEDCRNIQFEGVTIRNGRGWTNTLINCREVEYNFVKVMGFGPSSDGVNPAGSQNVRITNCFLRNTDDCVAIKASDYNHPVKNVYVANNIMIGFAYADGVTIGFETNAKEISNVIVTNCDILMARGGSRVDGHSGFSIICDGPAKINDILFENIRVEQSEIKLFELNITDGTLYGEDLPGHISDVTVRNVNWFHEGPIVLQGLDQDHQVENVLFENCIVAGQPLKNLQDKLFRKNEFVKDVKIE